MSDIAADVRDIVVFHLGVEETRLADGTRLADLGADRLDLVEIAMSCEERFEIDIPNHVAIGFATVGDAVRFVEAQLARAAEPAPPRVPVRQPVGRRLGETFHALLRRCSGVFGRTASSV